MLIRDFNHQTFTEAFLGRIEKGELAAAVEAARAEVVGHGVDLTPAFVKHVLPILEKRHLIKHVEQQLRSDRKLILNATPLLGKDRAAALNQVMVLALVEAAKKKPGLLTESGVRVEHIVKTENQYVLKTKPPGAAHVAGPFEEIVLRHGPEKDARYEFVKDAYKSYCAHHASLCLANPSLLIPPRLHPETFDHFDVYRVERLTTADEKMVAKEAAAQRGRTIRIDWDGAFKDLVQRGSRTISEIAGAIEKLDQDWTIVLAAPSNLMAEHIEALVRLKAASRGRLRIAASDAVHADWVVRLPWIGEIHAPPSPYPPAPMDDGVTLWDALDACLLRYLDEGISAAETYKQCEGLGDIHPSIAATLGATWKEWRTGLDKNALVRGDFLRLLNRVELAGKGRWDGDVEQVGRLVSGLVLMLAAHAGETLIPHNGPPGNLTFGKGGVALGSGCQLIEGKRISDFGDPAAWNVDALILSHGEDGMFGGVDLMTEAGDDPTSLIRANRLPPVFIPASLRWRKLLSGDIGPWSDAVQAEFEIWRARQKQAVGDQHA